MNEFCGQPTRSGKPCNMRKGHNANFHRHRDYPTPMQWEIQAPHLKLPNVFVTLEKGSGREELGYAITQYLEHSDKLVIKITRSVPVGS